MSETIGIRMDQLGDHYRRFMNQTRHAGYDSEYGMSLMQIAAIMTVSDAIELLANSIHESISDLASSINRLAEETDV
jgi:hypothetical protein